MTTPQQWRVPWLWRFGLWLSRVIVPVVCRLRVSTSMPYHLTRGPLILAGNHIGTFDPIITTAACARMRIAPRMMATGGLFRARVIGPLMRAAGHIPVDRGRETVTNAVPDAVAALAAGSTVFIYPEGRIGLDPGMWPERARATCPRHRDSRMNSSSPMNAVGTRPVSTARTTVPTTTMPSSRHSSRSSAVPSSVSCPTSWISLLVRTSNNLLACCRVLRRIIRSP